jgi:hypothetical protein
VYRDTFLELGLQQNKTPKKKKKFSSVLLALFQPLWELGRQGKACVPVFTASEEETGSGQRQLALEIWYLG